MMFGKLNPDFAIQDGCNLNSKSCSYLGSTYNPYRMKYKSKEANCYLAGSESFRVKEIEVFSIKEGI